MKLTKLTAAEASRLAVRTLGLDADSVDLASREGIAASLRRAASFLCPTSPGRLVDAVYGAAQPLHSDSLSREDISDVLDLVVGSGDLLELRQGSGRSTRLLYLAPPSYVERAPGTYLLIGVRPFGASLFEDELVDAIDYEGHTRTLRLDPATAHDRLRAVGLHHVPKERWVASPSAGVPADLIRDYLARLDVAGPTGQLDGLHLLDPTRSVRYYSGRWRSPQSGDTGDFIARRPQAYGADLWCVARFEAGVAQRLVEFPLNDPLVPGRDEAWRFQAAVDAQRGYPQQFRVRRSGKDEDDCIFDFFSPLPGFAERYVQFVGLALGKVRGALLSYRVPSAASADMERFLTDMLWMAREEEPSDV